MKQALTEATTSSVSLQQAMQEMSYELVQAKCGRAELEEQVLMLRAKVDE
eukprot:m.143855 g.143855  ORF g.143855 m.143855 type:complete len:50 (+) comp16178_c0_seq3:2569-2718(+)